MKAGRILVVDDEAHLRNVLSIILTDAGHLVSSVENGQQALGLLDQQTFDLILCDINMPVLDGLRFLQQAMVRERGLHVIMLTAFASVEDAVRAMKLGAFDYLTKPFNDDDILLHVQRALERCTLITENQRLKDELYARYDFSQIVGQSESTMRLLKKIARIADTSGSVLITGESGTGKELVAKAIHYNSVRRGRPIVTVDCSAIPATLIESELFGHTKGAFTHATQNKIGLIEEADGSTLFLDEIGELPLELQPKLLRVLQEQEIRRVGESRPRKIDFRLIAATHRDLLKEIEAGRFRSDLYYRLNVIRLEISPLRDRPDDIPLLAHTFLKKASAKHQRPVNHLSADLLRQFASYRWPGNIRELENLVEQAVIMAETDTLQLADVPPLGEPTIDRSEIVVRIPVHTIDFKQTMDDVVSQAEQQLIRNALQRTAGNRRQAADLLGISLRSLMYKLKEGDEATL